MRWWVLLLVALGVLAIGRSVVFVDQAETVIVTQFGRPVAVLNERLDDAGLHFKLPYQSVIRIDRRLQMYDPRPSEFLAKEKKNVDLDVFVCWRVAEPQKFLETVNDFPGAESRLHDLIWSELAAEVGRNELEALVSVNPEKHRLAELIEAVHRRVSGVARHAYGIEIVDVRLKRINYPAQVRESVFERMRTERARIASQYRAEGEEQAIKIRASADKERTVLLAKAQAEAERIRGEAEAEAIRIYGQAYGTDPRFYQLIRTLEAYERFLDDKTTIVLSTDSELLRLLTQPPAETTVPPMAADRGPGGISATQ